MSALSALWRPTVNGASAVVSVITAPLTHHWGGIISGENSVADGFGEKSTLGSASLRAVAHLNAASWRSYNEQRPDDLPDGEPEQPSCSAARASIPSPGLRVRPRHGHLRALCESAE